MSRYDVELWVGEAREAPTVVARNLSRIGNGEWVGQTKWSLNIARSDSAEFINLQRMDLKDGSASDVHDSSRFSAL